MSILLAKCISAVIIRTMVTKRPPNRKGAGRPRLPKWERRIEHIARPAHEGGNPVHVTMRAEKYLPSLRGHVVAREIGRALHGAKRRERGVAQFSIQENHLHLIFEAADKATLLRNVRGVAIALAKAINRALRRDGRVFADRYHANALSEPQSVRSALVYVLMNHKKHGIDDADVDPMSSARWFDGWRHRQPRPSTPAPVSPPVTRLLSTDWRSCGLIRLSDMPRNSKPGPRDLAEMMRFARPVPPPW